MNKKEKLNYISPETEFMEMFSDSLCEGSPVVYGDDKRPGADPDWGEEVIF